MGEEFSRVGLLSAPHPDGWVTVHTSERVEEKMGERGEDAFLKIQPVCVVLVGFPRSRWEPRAPAWH